MYIRRGTTPSRGRLSSAPVQDKGTMAATRIILLLIAIDVSSGLSVKSHLELRRRPMPPHPRYDGVFENGHNHQEIGNFAYALPQLPQMNLSRENTVSSFHPYS